MPASTGDSEEIDIIVDIAEDVESSVVLEEEVHLDTDAADIFEHIRELHVLWIRAEAIKAENKRK